MTDAQRGLIQKAHERLEAAQYLHDGDFLDDAVSRAYYAYAMAHAAEAALVEHDIAPDTHKGLQMQFGKHFVKTGIFPPDMGRNLRRILDLRQMADYSGTDLSAESAQTVIDHASAFVDTVEFHLEPDTDS